MFQSNIKELCKQHKITLKKIKEYIQYNLNTNDKWLYRALVKLFEYQTIEEQVFDESRELNRVGFNSTDAQLLSSYAKQYNDKHFLTPKQKEWCRKKIVKYWEQIWNISFQEQIVNNIIRGEKKND